MRACLTPYLGWGSVGGLALALAGPGRLQGVCVWGWGGGRGGGECEGDVGGERGRKKVGGGGKKGHGVLEGWGGIVSGKGKG